MEVFNASVLGLLIIFVSLSYHFLFHKRTKNLPPGTSGYPMLGESIEFLSTGRKGHPESFIYDRLAKYSSKIFRTNLFGYRTFVFCGAEANKFLFSNENKLVHLWWPSTVEKIFPFPDDSTAREDPIRFRKVLQGFLKPEALQRYVGVMDSVSHTFFDAHWENQDQVLAFPLAKLYTFVIACRLLLSVEDPKDVAKYQDTFDILNKGSLSMPIDLPGTSFNRAIKTSKYLRMKIAGLVKQRKIDLAEGKATPTQDILSHMILICDENGKYMSEEDIGKRIVGLIVAGYETASSAITSVVRYLAELPEIYQNVYNEQMEIANLKGEGELLNWEDIKKMKYSWNFACEAMRLSPPLQGTFREAIADFMYNGYSIPKDWKIYWSTHSTQRNPECFPEPLKFDPSRFEGSGPAPYTFVPFGGGPRMCPGKEYARLEILVFMHHLVKRFKLEKVIPDEKIIIDPMPSPEKGLPMRLIPHKKV